MLSAIVAVQRRVKSSMTQRCAPAAAQVVRSSVEIPRSKLFCFLELDSENW